MLVEISAYTVTSTQGYRCVVGTRDGYLVVDPDNPDGDR